MLTHACVRQPVHRLLLLRLCERLLTQQGRIELVTTYLRYLSMAYA